MRLFDVGQKASNLAKQILNKKIGYKIAKMVKDKFASSYNVLLAHDLLLDLNQTVQKRLENHAHNHTFDIKRALFVRIV